MATNRKKKYEDERAANTEARELVEFIGHKSDEMRIFTAPKGIHRLDIYNSNGIFFKEVANKNLASLFRAAKNTAEDK